MSSPTIENTVLGLRPLHLDDSAFLLKLRSDPRVNEFIDRKPFSKIEDSYAFINKINRGIEDGQWHYWAIDHMEDNSTIGTICLWNFNAERTEAEIGYELDPDYHRQGLMTQAVELLFDFVDQEHVCALLTAHIFKDNVGSIRLLSKLGFTQSGRLEDDPKMLRYQRPMVAYT